MLNPALWIISRFRPVWVEYNSVYRGELALVAPAAARLHAWSMFWLRHSRARHLPINREIGIEEGLNGNVQVLGNGWDSPSQSVSVELAEDHCQKLGELSKQYRPLGVFVAGDNAAWHGFDRILKVVDQHQFGLILVGPRQEGELVDLLTERQQLVQLGYLEPAALPAVYSFADFGFGTFALDRKNQKEACPLKVRDYLTSGLRVVINYADPLLDVPWASPFLYQYEKDKAKTLLAFLNSPYDRDRLAEEACERLDWVALFAEVGVLGGAGA